MTPSFGQELARLRAARGLSLAQLAQLVPCHRGYIAQLEHGDRRPSPPLARKLDDALGARGLLAELATQEPARRVQSHDGPDSEFEALELARRVAASDVGETALIGLEQATDRLVIAYQATPPALLLPEIRLHLGYIEQLVGRKATLSQQRRLLIVGGWLSLLAATVDIDLRMRPAASARLATAASLAHEADFNEIVAWCLETEAWDALTDGRYERAVTLSQSAQQVAPRSGSAIIQATAQEGRAWARLADRAQSRDALRRVERMVSPLPVPDQPEHHFRYDPTKQLVYTATALSWIADPAAERHSRELLARLESGRDGGLRPRRIATARLDLALALTRLGQLDEAVAQAILALQSGRIVPSSAWRAAEILEAVEANGLHRAVELRDAYQSIRVK